MSKDPDFKPVSTSQAYLGFDPADLVSLRVKPADFARMCNVSRQCVSKWLKKGTITIGPDGLLDPVAAGRQVLARTDPARLRARVFRDALQDVDALRADRKRLQAENEALRSELAVQHEAMKFRLHTDDINDRLTDFVDAVRGHLNAVDAGGRLSEREIEILCARHFWRFTEDLIAELETDLDETSSATGRAGETGIERAAEIDTALQWEEELERVPGESESTGNTGNTGNEIADT